MSRLFTGGSSHRLDVGTWAITTQQITLACWVRWTAINSGRDDRIISKASGTAANAHDWMLGISGSASLLRCRFNNTNLTLLGTTTLSTGAWRHCVATFDNGDAELFLDGISDNSTSGFNTGALPNNTDAIYVGNQPTATTNAPAAYLADAAVWNRLLTANELEQLAAGARPGDFNGDSSLQLWLPIWGDHSPEIDLSGLGRTGAVTGAVKDGIAPRLVPFGKTTRRIFVPPSAGGGPQNIDVLQTEETDSVLALTRSKAKALGLNTETDTAQIVRPNRLRLVGLTNETDTAQAVTFTKSKALGLNTETDTAQAVTALRPIAAGLTTETDTAQAVTFTKSKAVGLNAETDTAFSAAAQRNYPAGLTTETDAAQAVTFTKAKALGLALELDEAQAVGSGDNTPIAVGLTTESDSAFPVSFIKVKAVGLTFETAAAQAIASAKTRAVELVNETDTAFPVSRTQQVQLGIAMEAAEAFALTFFKVRGITLAIEVDVALPIEQPEKPLDPSAYFAVSVSAQGPMLFEVASGPSHAKLFNV